METFQQLCQSRRSIRKYQAKAVEQEKIDYILRCALMSPSSKRTNPWEFVVIRKPETLKALVNCRSFGSGMFATAPVGIVIGVDGEVTDTWQCDGAIAAQTILLAAEEQGLGACWCQIYGRTYAKEDGTEASSEELVRQLVNIPEKMHVLCVISLGYKDDERKQYDLEKLLYNKIHNEQF